MKTSIQLSLERRIIKPALWVVNIFVRILGKVLRIDHSLNKDFKVIAVCKYKGLGSIIQSTSLLQTLRANYPDAKIIYISTVSNKMVIEKISIVDEYILLDDKSFFSLMLSFFPFMYRLIKSRIEAYLDLEIYSHFSSLICTMSLAKNRVGYYLRSTDYRMGIYTHMMFYNINIPIRFVYLQMARLLGVGNICSDLYNLLPDRDDLYLGACGINNTDKYFVININASDLRLERRWSLECFVELIMYIKDKYPDKKLILIGNKAEHAYVEKLMLSLDDAENVIDVSGKTSFDELISIISNAEVVITNDTGPMHIAFSVKTTTIALFGPCSPLQYGIFENCKIIYHQVYCSPCVHEFAESPCKGDNQCMKQIKAGEVIEKIDEVLACGDINSDFSLTQDNIYTKLNDETLGIISRAK